MKTVSLGITSYCVPCPNHCRYCLLASEGKAPGAEYARSKAFAARVIRELQKKRPDVSAQFYVGYCMDLPDLSDYIRFSRKLGFPGARFLQMNGFALRGEEETAELIKRIREEGVELIDLTFFGGEEYHDRFAGRKGDHSLLLRMLDAAEKEGLPVHLSVPLFRENLGETEALRRTLRAHSSAGIGYFLPNGKGRGRFLEEQRITWEEFDALPEEIRADFPLRNYRTEGEWIVSGQCRDPEKRSLTVVLTRENIEEWEGLSAEEILRKLEALDDDFLARMPSVPELARRYGDPEGRRLYRLRDLIIKWQQTYIAEEDPGLWDMNEETRHFSAHT